MLPTFPAIPACCAAHARWWAVRMYDLADYHEGLSQHYPSQRRAYLAQANADRRVARYFERQQRELAGRPIHPGCDSALDMARFRYDAPTDTVYRVPGNFR